MRISNFWIWLPHGLRNLFHLFWERSIFASSPITFAGPRAPVFYLTHQSNIAGEPKTLGRIAKEKCSLPTRVLLRPRVGGGLNFINRVSRGSQISSGSLQYFRSRAIDPCVWIRRKRAIGGREFRSSVHIIHCSKKSQMLFT